MNCSMATASGSVRMPSSVAAAGTASEASPPPSLRDDVKTPIITKDDRDEATLSRLKREERGVASRPLGSM